MLCLEPNGEVNRKLFLFSTKVMKEGIFSKWSGGGLANKDTIFWISERGVIDILSEESKREGYIF